MRFILALILVLAAGAPAHAAANAAAGECVTPIGPAMKDLRASGIEFEEITDGLTVLKIIAVLKRNAEKPFPMPDKIVIAFLREESKIGLIAKERLCAIITAPTASVRAMLMAIRGRGA